MEPERLFQIVGEVALTVGAVTNIEQGWERDPHVEMPPYRPIESASSHLRVNRLLRSEAELLAIDVHDVLCHRENVAAP